ncbi:MAG TPA: peptidylprolyl isomerase [Gemmatimonadaceae bacterium]|nr:peptidylprolyl isomerase [Gemmatimonadaceae bacterium]
MKREHVIARVAFAILFCTCAAPRADSGGAAHASSTAGAPRLPDGLLERADLQTVVGAALARDADSLIGYLASPDTAVRARAAYELASVQDPSAAPTLGGLLADSSASVREDVAFAIGQLRDSASCGRVLHAFAGESSPRVRYLMLEALGKCGDRSVLDRLLRIVGSEPSDDEGVAVALGGFGRRRITSAVAKPLLIRLIGSDDKNVAELAAIALAAPREARPWGVSEGGILTALRGQPRSSTAAGPLLSVLARSGDESALEDVVQWLDSAESWRTRVAAARALAPWTERNEAREALMAALDDRSIHVGTTAAQVLSGARPSTGADMQGWEEWIRAHRARWQVGRLLLPGILAGGDTDFVTQWASRASEAGIPRWAGYDAIAEVDRSEAFELLLSGLDGPDRRSTYVAAAALARRAAKIPMRATDVDRMAAILDIRLAVWGPHAPGSDVRGVIALLEALHASGRARAEDAIRRAAEHPHPGIRRKARALLGLPIDSYRVPTSTAIDWSYLARLGPHPRVVIETERGAITVELDAEAAPLSTYVFSRLAESGEYDGLTFHRVEAAFILQSGDYDSQASYGGPWDGEVSEFTRIPFRAGTIGMASSAKDTEGSQYFITHGSSTSLDGRYTALGRVVDGASVADAIALGDSVIAVNGGVRSLERYRLQLAERA